VAAGRRSTRLSERGAGPLRRQALGFVFQRFHLMDELTAVENVELPAAARRAVARAARARALELLDEVGLADRAGHPALGALGRPAAAGRDRPRAQQRAARRAGRRADRQPRQRARRSDVLRAPRRLR
jgi:ABC-type glutathione transport system ATPase component